MAAEEADPGPDVAFFLCDLFAGVTVTFCLKWFPFVWVALDGDLFVDVEVGLAEDDGDLPLMAGWLEDGVMGEGLKVETPARFAFLAYVCWMVARV